MRALQETETPLLPPQAHTSHLLQDLLPVHCLKGL